MAKLNRTLGLVECIFFGVGSILGAGIYTLIGKVAGQSGNLIWLAFIIASVTALFTAFSYAELSSCFPNASGEYEYAKNAFGKKMGVILGFSISLNGVISGATVALGFAGYLSSLIGIHLILAAAAIIILIFLINAYGIRESSVINIIFTLIEAGGLFFIIYCSLPYLGKVNYLTLPTSGFQGVLMASALAFFAFIGFEDIVKLAEETKKPEKNIPMALFSACLIVIVIYTIVAICIISVIPYKQLGQSASPLADVVRISYGQTGIIIISVIALFSTSNTILSNMLSSSRVLLKIAMEFKFLRYFSTLSRKKTPVKALFLVLFFMLAFAAIGRIEIVAMIANIFIFFTFLLINVCVIVLRVREESLERPFRIPGNINNIPVISVLGIIMTFFLFCFNLYNLL